ncbi:hypothetical protein MRB53_005834 [Persea americana]|uniref:Uncharacterized protein n=1 Tax=Persea americana TaxID=3435 RepID=A0ACC2MEM5_PERAE|nr:hypothetical protein MRB53_005834 [Persea americana]
MLTKLCDSNQARDIRHLEADWNLSAFSQLRMMPTLVSAAMQSVPDNHVANLHPSRKTSVVVQAAPTRQS